MSKAKEDQPAGSPADTVSEIGHQVEKPAELNPDNGSGKNILAIEEHKKNLNIDSPVFAAVMQSKGWGSGKKVGEAVFKKAVKDFLGAPMGGIASSGIAAPKGGV